MTRSWSGCCWLIPGNCAPSLTRRIAASMKGPELVTTTSGSRLSQPIALVKKTGAGKKGEPSAAPDRGGTTNKHGDQIIEKKAVAKEPKRVKGRKGDIHYFEESER